jgi:TnpA family transposase
MLGYQQKGKKTDRQIYSSGLEVFCKRNFIPCGLWEGAYILDLLMNENVDIKPHIIHSDTQGQNETIFGLSFLLGIERMPLIRNWKNLKFYKSDKSNFYEHIDELFTDTIDWELIKTYLHDMLRVALSIKLGRITPSTILKKLWSYSRKNKLYQAFSELGKAECLAAKVPLPEYIVHSSDIYSSI